MKISTLAIQLFALRHVTLFQGQVLKGYSDLQQAEHNSVKQNNQQSRIFATERRSPIACTDR